MTVVTPVSSELSKVISSDVRVTRREQTRERVARHRAKAKLEKSIEFVRTDASLFLLPDRLSQKAGAPKHLIRRMALKELVDNALDAAATATLTTVNEDTFVVTDDGPGIDPERVPVLFSVTRPMMSSKLVRRPTRGMVGNGLRVVTGAAFASGGYLVVESSGMRQELSYDRQTGETIVTATNPSDVVTGARITIVFGTVLPRDSNVTEWADLAIRLAGKSAEPMLTHPDWYSVEGFQEVVDSVVGSARDLASVFGVDLGNGPARGIEQGQSDGGKRYIDGGMPASALTLDLLRSMAPAVPKLLPIPPTAFPGSYKAEAIVTDVAGGAVPAIVQVWASEITGRPGVTVQLIVNRTPAVADISIQPGGDAYIYGCGLRCWTGPVPKSSYYVVIAVTTPAIALISDGKTPDLSPFAGGLVSAIGTAMKKAHQPKKREVSIKDASFEVMEDAYLKASAGGTLPANARQVMYAARGYILDRTGKDELGSDYFTQTLLPEYIRTNGEVTSGWDIVYDARGHLVEPHTGTSIPLGTLQVRSYLQRKPFGDVAFLPTATGLYPTVGPGDRYGAVLFIEKEGFEPLLRAAQIAERYDIAVMSTKGMSVVAARVMIDRLSTAGMKILVAHDLDASGMGIFGTLGGDGDRYRFRARPNIHRLGLTLDQAHAMDLLTEKQSVKGNKVRVAQRLGRYGATKAEIDLILSGRRIELNAMPSNVFVQWLEQELDAHGIKKIVPPMETVEEHARHLIGLNMVKAEAAEIERNARLRAASVTLPSDLTERVQEQYRNTPAASWEEALAAVINGWQGEESA